MHTGIEMHNISYQYKDGSFKIDNFNLSAKSGEVICILGSSGCGKSTILKLISGLESGVSGRISINNKIVLDQNTFVPPEKRDIGFVFQYSALFPHATVYENIAISIHNCDKESQRRAIHETLNLVNMEQYINHYPHMLSGGQQQRINIARAIAQSPQIILLDEPFTNLDTNLRSTIRNESLLFFKQKQITTIIVTHDPSEALEISDQIYFLDNGKVIQHGTPEDLYFHPYNFKIANFFSDFIIIDKNICITNTDHIISQIGYISLKNYKFSINDIVTIYMRPNALYIDINGNITGTVKDIRFNICHIMINNSIYKIQLHLAFLPNIGDIINMSLDERQVFVFSDLQE